MDPFIHYAVADRVDAEADAESAPPASGTPSAADLAEINRRCALARQSADDLYIWSFEISNTRVDSHGTWMDLSSLRNYERGANEGRGYPYLRHHDTYADEMGRVFRGAIIEAGTMSRSAPRRVTPLARDVFGRGDGVLRRLVETAYTRRDLEAAPDLIARLESGISASNSIGFGVYTPASPGSLLRCDICGHDIFKRDADRFLCPHLPGWETEASVGEGDEARSVNMIATAAVVNATQREASGVYLGSTPGTFTLATRAADLFAAGLFDEKTARGYEDMHRLTRGTVTGAPRTIFDMGAGRGADTPAPIELPLTSDKSGAETPARETSNEGVTMDIETTIRGLIEGDQDLLAAFELEDRTDPLAALVRSYGRQGAALRAEADQARAASEALKASLTKRVGAADGESLSDALDRVLALATLGKGARDRLIDELLRQMTRAGLPYEPDTQRAIAERMTVAEIEAQTAMYKTAADREFTPGRVSEPDVKPRGSTSPATRPNPALVG